MSVICMRSGARWAGPGRRRWRPGRFPCRRGRRRACRRGARGEVFKEEGGPWATGGGELAARRRRWGGCGVGDEGDFFLRVMRRQVVTAERAPWVNSAGRCGRRWAAVSDIGGVVSPAWIPRFAVLRMDRLIALRVAKNSWKCHLWWGQRADAEQIVWISLRAFRVAEKVFHRILFLHKGCIKKVACVVETSSREGCSVR